MHQPDLVGARAVRIIEQVAKALRADECDVLTPCSRMIRSTVHRATSWPWPRSLIHSLHDPRVWTNLPHSSCMRLLYASSSNRTAHKSPYHGLALLPKSSQLCAAWGLGQIKAALSARGGVVSVARCR
jgi:hypothetical protein